MGSYLSQALHEFVKACHLFDDARKADRAKAEKHRMIMFGVAAITLDAARADLGTPLPTTIVTEHDQFVSLAYMLRCAPAHDISVPVWTIKKGKYRRRLIVGADAVDLTNLDGSLFEFAHIGGPETFVRIASHAMEHRWVAVF